MVYSYIKHDDLNDGSAIDLNGVVATFDYNNFVISREVPGKDTTASWDTNL